MIPATCRVATYNIHRCRGTDGRYDPARVAQVVLDMKADLVGLQEVDTGLMVPLCERRHAHKLPASSHLPPGDEACGGMHQLDFLTAQTGCHSAAGLMSRGHGKFGNVVLTPHPIKAVRQIDLTVRGAWERRGALDVDVSLHGRMVRVIVAHLGLEIWERYFQISRLLKAIGIDRKQPIIMMGDFNLLISFLPKLRRFYKRLGHTPVINTFPSRWPILSLDRIWVQPAAALIDLQRYDTPQSRLASDHLPLVGTIALSDL